MGVEEINPTDMEKLVYLIATGNRSEIDYYLDKWYKKGAAGVFARGLSEGVEETMEEVTTDLIKGIFKGAEALGVDISDEGKKTDFGFSLKDIASRYAMSFGGGFIGGMIFAGQNKYAK